MIELLIGIMIVLGLVAVQWTLESVSNATLIDLGLNLTAIGTVLGLLLAFYYHIRLLGGVKARGLPLERWWVDPRPLHRHFPPPQRRTLNLIFWVGLCLFGLAVGGAMIAAFAVWRV